SSYNCWCWCWCWCVCLLCMYVTLMQVDDFFFFLFYLIAFHSFLFFCAVLLCREKPETIRSIRFDSIRFGVKRRKKNTRTHPQNYQHHLHHLHHHRNDVE
ncbi:hypothetical protein SSS_09589, partial [Sarcoptes scabiei]